MKDSLLIGLGIASAGFGLKGFLLSSHFIDGGATGLSMLLNELTGAILRYNFSKGQKVDTKLRNNSLEEMNRT